MGIIDSVKEFYQPISSEHVLLLCAMDVDALCACKILQFLFKGDDVEHTIIPVAGKSDVKAAYSCHADQTKSVVMINCGGCVNAMELLELEDQRHIYIIDSQRPLHLDNVFSEQVHVVMREGDQLEVPDFDDIYSPEMEEDEYDQEYFSDEDSGPRSKRKRPEEESYEDRRKKHLWRRRREGLISKYYEFNYHETAASLVVYKLACLLNRDCNDLVWLAITGFTEQLLHEKIDSARYVADVIQLEQNVRRLNRSDEDTSQSAINSMRITFEDELRLAMYRHWTLYDSLCHSEYTACRFKIWSVKGQKKLLELLANMGVPLVQCQQKFSSMDIQYRNTVKQLIKDSAHKFQLDDIAFSSFVSRFGYRTALCASDMVFGSAAIMNDPDKPYSECFLKALEALSRPNLHIMCEGIKMAKQQQTAIVDQVKNFISTPQVVCFGPFVYADVVEGTPNVKSFSKPVTLCKLARFLRECWVVIHRKCSELPFLLSAPLDGAEGVCLMVGVSPHSEDTGKSEFAKAFQHAADAITAHASFDSFDGSVMEIKKEDKEKFLEKLIALSAV